MIKYEISHETLNLLKEMINILIRNKQNIFSCAELVSIQNSIFSAKPISCEQPKKEIKEIKKEVKNDGK